MRFVARGVLICLAACGAAAPGALAAVIGGQATSSPTVAVDGSGTGHAAWFAADGSNDVLRYCRLAAGSTSCSPALALRTAGPTANRLNTGQWPSVFAPRSGLVAILGASALEVSVDGGATFSPEPIPVPNFSGSHAALGYSRSTVAFIPGTYAGAQVDLLLGWVESGVDIRAVDISQRAQRDGAVAYLDGQGSYGAVGVTPEGRPFVVSRTAGSPGRVISHTYRGPMGPDGRPPYESLVASENWQRPAEVFPQGPPRRDGTTTGFGRGFHVETAAGATWLTEYGSDLDFRLGGDGTWVRGPEGNPQAQSTQHTLAVGPDGRLHVATGACYQRSTAGFGGWEPAMTLDGLGQINYLAADLAAGPNGGGFLVAPGGDEQILAGVLGQGKPGCGSDQRGGELPPVPPEFGMPPTLTATHTANGGATIEITVVCTSTVRDCRYRLEGELRSMRDAEEERARQQREAWSRALAEACGPRPPRSAPRRERSAWRRCSLQVVRQRQGSRASAAASASRPLSRVVRVTKGRVATFTLSLSPRQTKRLKREKVLRLRLTMTQTAGKDRRINLKGYVFAPRGR